MLTIGYTNRMVKYISSEIDEGQFVKIKKFIISSGIGKLWSFFLLFIIVFSIPITVFIAQKQQDIRQRASFEQEPNNNQNVVLPNLDEDTTSIGLKAKSLDGTGIAAPQQIKQKNLVSLLSSNQKPNILVIITDDQTYNQLSLDSQILYVYSSKLKATNNLLN